MICSVQCSASLSESLDLLCYNWAFIEGYRYLSWSLFPQSTFLFELLLFPANQSCLNTGRVTPLSFVCCHTLFPCPPLPCSSVTPCFLHLTPHTTQLQSRRNKQSAILYKYGGAPCGYWTLLSSRRQCLLKEISTCPSSSRSSSFFPLTLFPKIVATINNRFLLSPFFFL